MIMLLNIALRLKLSTLAYKKSPGPKSGGFVDRYCILGSGGVFDERMILPIVVKRVDRKEPGPPSETHCVCQEPKLWLFARLIRNFGQGVYRDPKAVSALVHFLCRDIELTFISLNIDAEGLTPTWFCDAPDQRNDLWAPRKILQHPSRTLLRFWIKKHMHVCLSCFEHKAPMALKAVIMTQKDISHKALARHTKSRGQGPRLFVCFVPNLLPRICHEFSWLSSGHNECV